MRPLRITKKRIVVSTLALDDFLTKFNENIVDSIDGVWECAYDQKEAEERAKGKPEDAGFDEDDVVANALMDLEFAMEYLRDMFSSRSHVQDGGYHASPVLVGKSAGTITIVRRSSPAHLDSEAMRDKAAELLAEEQDPWPPPELVAKHKPYFPDDDDLEPVFAELIEERYAYN